MWDVLCRHLGLCAGHAEALRGEPMVGSAFTSTEHGRLG